MHTVSLSGGSDSTALLYLSLYFNHSIVCCHINHGTRGGGSDKDELFCRKLCRVFGVKLFVKRLKMDRWGKSSELFARKARRRFLFRVRSSIAHGYDLRYKQRARHTTTRSQLIERVDRFRSELHQEEQKLFRDIKHSFGLLRQFRYKVLTGHTKDDFVETVFMKLIRGSSVAFLEGIRKNSRGFYRPLIGVEKQFLVRFIERLGFEIMSQGEYIKYCTDKSNAGNRYTRNKIRNMMIPIVSDINPEYRETIYRNLVNLEDLVLDYGRKVYRLRKWCAFGFEGRDNFSLVIFRTFKVSEQLSVLKLLVQKKGLRNARFRNIQEIRNFLICSNGRELKISNLLFTKTVIRFQIDKSAKKTNK